MKSEEKIFMKARRRNIALKISYDGTNYNGFQRQDFPSIAVQNILEDRLAKIFGERIVMTASGRTDAGVHALGQVVNFLLTAELNLKKFLSPQVEFFRQTLLFARLGKSIKIFLPCTARKAKFISTKYSAEKL